MVNRQCSFDDENKSERMRVAERLRQERKENGYTQDQISDILGYSKPTIVKWEKKDAKNYIPTMDQLFDLSKLYKCDVAYLLCEQNGRTREETDICAATGLSANAVEKLMLLSEISKKNASLNNTAYDRIECLSRLIEYDSGFALLGKICRCINLNMVKGDPFTFVNDTLSMQACEILKQHNLIPATPKDQAAAVFNSDIIPGLKTIIDAISQGGK